MSELAKIRSRGEGWLGSTAVQGLTVEGNGVITVDNTNPQQPVLRTVQPIQRVTDNVQQGAGAIAWSFDGTAADLTGVTYTAVKMQWDLYDGSIRYLYQLAVSPSAPIVGAVTPIAATDTWSTNALLLGAGLFAGDTTWNLDGPSVAAIPVYGFTSALNMNGGDGTFVNTTAYVLNDKLYLRSYTANGVGYNNPGGGQGTQILGFNIVSTNVVV